MNTATINIVTMIIRLFLSVLLFRAALHKQGNHKTFQAELGAYQLLPESLLPLTTFTLIFTEAVTSILLLNNQWQFPTLIAAVLFCVYALAMAVNLLKGRTSIDCGCGGLRAAKKTISWSLVIRNLILAVLALLCTQAAIAEAPGSLAIFIILAGAAVSLLIYEAIEQAIANIQGYRRWQAQRTLKH